jgi:hypothetical protein
LKLILFTVAAAMALPIWAKTQLTTDKWKPYRSEAGGFEVTYPGDWSVSAEKRGNSVVLFNTSPIVWDDDIFHAARIMICSTAIDEPAWNDCTERDSHLSALYKDSVRSRKDFVVSGLKIERVETSSKYDNAFFYYARFSSNGRRFFVRGNFTKSFNLDRYAPVFDKMLESFRLISAAKPNNSFSRSANRRALMRET